MNIENVKPEQIEQKSMEIIESELGDCSHLSKDEKQIVKRVIHTSADFDYLNSMKFSENAVSNAKRALMQNAVIVTDTHMAESGISKPALKALDCELHCFMSDEDVAKTARENGTTRAVASVDKAIKLYKNRNLIFVIGNAPTALIRIYEYIVDAQCCPSLVIGAPVGFVNVEQSKKLIMSTSVPYIVADGRKGGSSVAAAICNALLYQIYDRKQGKIISLNGEI